MKNAQVDNVCNRFVRTSKTYFLLRYVKKEQPTNKKYLYLGLFAQEGLEFVFVKSKMG